MIIGLVMTIFGIVLLFYALSLVLKREAEERSARWKRVGIDERKLRRKHGDHENR